jgi:hypothetical protein
VPAAHVDRHHHARPVLAHDLVEEVDVAERRRADDRPHRAGRERLAHRLDRAQAAAVLHRRTGRVHDPLEVLERLRRPGARAVEVDHVQVVGAGVDPRLRGRQRVVVVDGRLVVVALAQADRAPAEDVDRRVEDHAATRAQTPAKLRSSASPSTEDFSG